ncbi:MAG: glycerate kinase [Longimicrobiales bacterium]
MNRERLRDHARAIFQAGLEAVAPGPAVRRAVRVEGESLEVGGTAYPLGEVEGIRVVGMGKASAAMAGPLEEMLGRRIQGGVLVVKYGHGHPLEHIRVMEAGHPVPDAAGEAGAREIIRALAGADALDLVFCLISGGGSALSPAPVSGISLKDKQEVTRLLLASGATIHEMNTVRKHLSRLKGGQLARWAHPARVVSLILSDVVGDDLDTIASGPTVPDPGTYRDALSVLENRGLRRRLPASVLTHLQSGARGEVPETPKPGDLALSRVQNLIVGSNALALRAARDKARELGYSTLTPRGFQEGEAREVAEAHVELARAIRSRAHPVPPPACILTGGETTVTLRGNGTGGRNQEFALAAAIAMEGMDDVVLLSAGTDGTDGPTDAAGAMVDGGTVARGRDHAMEAADYLARNDSYHFFRPLGDLLVTGPTLTNVMDLRIILVD